MEEKGKIKSFRDLDVWKLGMEIVVDVYEVTKSFPKEEVYGLISQMRRAAVSIASNIAEGFNRYHNKEYKQFLYIALGSCAELETQIILVTDFGFLKNNDILKKITSVRKMLVGLIKYLKNKSIK